MAEIVLKNIKKIYPNEKKRKSLFGKKTEQKKSNLEVTEEGVVAVQDFNLTINEHEFVVLVGPSGCGKSTTLRMIAGLEDISAGELYIDGKLVNDVAPKDRDIAMVFQSYALYPNMTVYENMAFTLKLKRLTHKSLTRRFVQLQKHWALRRILIVNLRHFLVVSVSALQLVVQLFVIQKSF